MREDQNLLSFYVYVKSIFMAKCKFYKEIQYYSDDMGQTWFPTGLSRKGELIESGSTDCDEPTPPTPPTPVDGKYLFTYSDSSTRSRACDASSAITSADTKSAIYPYTAMTKAQIGDCVKTISEEAFSDCTSLSSVTLNEGLQTIGDYAFASCSNLTSITIPNSVTSIGQYAFGECTSLTSVDIPDSVETIDGGAFLNCSGLTNVTIGSGVSRIYIDAFASCSNLQSITIEAVTPPTLGPDVFYDTNNCQIYVPSNSVSTYKSTSGWSAYRNRIQAIQ